MRRNIGPIDRLIRTLIVVIIATLYFLGFIWGTTATVLMTVATVLLLTSFISYCPLYKVFGISTVDKTHA